MPFQTNLNTPPYFDDYDETKDFAKILFKPGVSVQTRELVQLQTLLQKQIERMGNNLFKQGTIVSGCNFTFYPAFSYIKIKDNQVDGSFAVVSNYDQQFCINQTTGLVASIQQVLDGFESTPPDLKTLYVKYTNAGANGSVESYAPNDVVRIYNMNRSIWQVDITNGGTGFSNTDTVVFSSALIANVASGTFSNGQYITNNLGANVQIVGIDTVTYAAQSQIVLNVAPAASVLTNVSSNSVNWTISIGQDITNTGNTAAAHIEGVIGTGARGRVITDGVGKITSIAILARGQQYTVAPYVSVKSANNASGISTVSLAGRNYIADVTVSGTGGAVGNGYAFSVSDGVVYQRGAFLRVAAQTLVVSKYDTTPSNVAVGFTSTEEIIDANIDPSLLDNVDGSDAASAPGADRLKVTPTLELLTADAASSNADFFTLVAWSEGLPYKQNQVTSFNTITDEIARQTMETEGNYVVDSFLLATRSPIDSTMEGGYYSLVTDPGIAYINGYRVQTSTNFALDVPKPTTTIVANSQFLSLVYGNWLPVNQFGGTFQFNTGDSVDLYDTAKGFVTNTALVIAGNTNPVGTKIGTANIRSLTLNDNTNAGNPTYRLYMFNVTMLSGKSFKDVKSVYYNGTKKGICDVVLLPIAGTGANGAVLQEALTSRLLFTTGVDSMLNANGVNYLYRTIDQAVSFANTGVLQKDNSAHSDEIFPYTGVLSTDQMRNLFVVPTQADIVGTANITGASSVNTTSNTATGSGTAYLTDLAVGDYVYAYVNTSVFQVKRIVGITNNTFIQLDSNCSFANASAGMIRCFPKNVPIPFGTRSGLTANVNAGQTVLTLNLGLQINSASSLTASLGYNVQRVNPTQASKTPNRHQFVKIDLANNAGGVVGPWAIGVPDVFRLRGVYIGSNSSVSNTGTNSVTSFQIDHNQNPDFLDISWLYVADKAPVTLTSAQWLLVEFDYYTGTGGSYYTPTSYVSSNLTTRVLTDSQPLANLTSSVNSFEVPQVIDNQGTEYDLLQQFDFRPYAANTVAPGSSPSAAPVNPSGVTSFGNTSSSAAEKKFPVPSTQFAYNVEFFLGRTDSVHVHQDGNITVDQGRPDINPAKRYSPATPSDAMKLADLNVPAYPTLPMVYSSTLNQILTTSVFNGRFTLTRPATRTVTKASSNSTNAFTTPRVYTMADIGQLDRRLSDVEYETALNLLEANTVNLNIPSSVDPSLNRFKYGFFADDLSTFDHSDITNPNYDADIQNDAAVPPMLNWDSSLATYIGGPDYIDFKIVSQDNATWPDQLGPVCVLQYVTYDIQSGNTIIIHVPSANVSIPVFVSNELPIVGENEEVGTAQRPF